MGTGDWGLGTGDWGLGAEANAGINYLTDGTIDQDTEFTGKVAKDELNKREKKQ